MPISITLNKPQGSPYMPGETLIGTVSITLSAPFTCEFCTLTLEGSGYAHVEEVQCHTPDGRLDRHIVVVEDNETYFTSAIPLLGQSIIPKGNTKFPFEYSLPTSNLPCSIEAPNGNVSYRVAVHAKSPENVNDDYPEKDLRSSIHFIVGPLLDLNRYPRLADFTTITHFEEVQIIAGKCCSCSDSNYVKVHIIVPKRVFIPGELVRFGMQIQNSSERDLECGTMQLVLAINCISRGRRADAEHILAGIKGPAVNARCTQNWEVDNLMIPATGPLGLPPTGLGGGCNVVDADYGLKYCVKLPGWYGEGLSVFVPLLVGTIPLKT